MVRISWVSSSASRTTSADSSNFRCERDANEKEARAEKTYLPRVVPGRPAHATSGAFPPTTFSDHCDLKYLLDAVRASIYFRALNRIRLRGTVAVAQEQTRVL